MTDVAKEVAPLRGSGGGTSLGTPDPVVAIWQAFAEGRPVKAARLLAGIRLRRALSRVADQDEARVSGIEAGLRHAKRCLRCGRTLTDPESISRGIGPDCWDRVKGAA